MKKPSDRIAEIMEQIINERIDEMKKKAILQPDMAITKEKEERMKLQMAVDPFVAVSAVWSFLDEQHDNQAKK